MIPLDFGLWLVLLQRATEVLPEWNVLFTKETILHYVGSLWDEDETHQAFRGLWDSGLFEELHFKRRDKALVVTYEEKPLGWT